MKNFVLTSTISSKSTVANAGAEEEGRSETRGDSCCYYPGCRKDANCNCEICLASINATLDLMPISVQKSSLTMLTTASRPSPMVEVTPISFGSSSLSTPKSSSPPIPMSPSLRSSARINFKEKIRINAERNYSVSRVDFLRPLLFLSLIFMAEYGFSWAVSGVVKPLFSHAMVRNLGEKSWAVKDLNGKLRFLQRELQGLVLDGKVSNCSYLNSRWEISQDSFLLTSHCKFYKSSMEEIRIWGWPLQTAGLLTTGISSRSFTVISGRVTEWSDGKVGYIIRKDSSWTHQKWGLSAVQFDRNTWILEYRRSSMLENPRLVSATLAFLKYRVSRIVGQMKQDFWLFSVLESKQHQMFAAKSTLQVPT